jgi:hypothetical protein
LLVARVQGAMGSGLLNAGLGNSLSKKLQQALSALATGRVAVCKSNLRAFINEVTSLVSEGMLASSEGAPFIATAEALLRALGS